MRKQLSEAIVRSLEGVVGADLRVEARDRSTDLLGRRLLDAPDVARPRRAHFGAGRHRASGLDRGGVRNREGGQRAQDSADSVGRRLGDPGRRAADSRRHHARHEAHEPAHRDQRAVVQRDGRGRHQRRSARVDAERPWHDAAALSGLGQLRHARWLPGSARVGHDQHEVRQGRRSRDEHGGRARRRHDYPHAGRAQPRVWPGLHAPLPRIRRHVRRHHRSDDADHAAAGSAAVPRAACSRTWRRASRPVGD